MPDRPPQPMNTAKYLHTSLRESRAHQLKSRLAANVIIGSIRTPPGTWYISAGVVYMVVLVVI